jgi:RNA polymerase subunit RPABC4/transcription elongation factor Spt4
MTYLQEIHGRLQNAAMKITNNFCYSCYTVVEGDHCPTCGTDDFMRHLSGVGVEYGTEWVIAHLIKNKLTPVDGDEMYEELLDECYPEVKIGESVFSPSQVIKELDPVCFDMGAKENLDSLAEDGVLYEYSGDYYRMEDLDDMLDDLEAQ